MINNTDNIRYERGKPFFAHYYEKKVMGDWDLHYHDVLEIFYLVDGVCNFFIDDKMYTLRSGDMVLIPAWTLHRAFYDNDVPISRYMIYCNTAFIPPKTGEILLSSGHYVERIPKSLGDAEDILFKIRKERLNPNLLSEELIHGYMTAFAALIYKVGEIRKSTDLEYDNSIVEAVVAYLKTNYSNDISLDDIARHVSVSNAHLSRTFKSETGFGIKEYLTMYRIKQAEFMLTEYHSKSISEIAYDCGFNDSNYFASCFKKAVGVTPTEFRKGYITK